MQNFLKLTEILILLYQQTVNTLRIHAVFLSIRDSYLDTALFYGKNVLFMHMGRIISDIISILSLPDFIFKNNLNLLPFFIFFFCTQKATHKCTHLF